MLRVPACISRSDREGILGSLPQEGLGPFHQSAEKEHRDVEKAVYGTYNHHSLQIFFSTPIILSPLINVPTRSFLSPHV